MNNSEKIYIHDNGDRPFMVCPKKESDEKYQISIYGQDYKKLSDSDSNEEDSPTYSKLAIPPITAEKVFIGESPKNEMTEFSAGYGPKFEGNSILLHISDNEYIFIGQNIFSFTAYSKIIEYLSPVGNSDVPYPYAIDDQDNYYLMVEGIVLKVPVNAKEDPYRYYYNKHSITAQIFYYRLTSGDNSEPIPRKLFINNFCGIKKFYIGGEPYELTYHSNPERNYERLEKWDDFGEGLEVDKTDGKRYKLSKGEYIDLIERYGQEAGFFPFMNKDILHKRMW